MFASNLEVSSSRQRLLFYKIKGLRLSGWDLLHGRRGCPHYAESGVEGGSTYHIVWQCPAARRLWAVVRDWWASLGLWTERTPDDDRHFLTAVFSLRLPRTPPKVWSLASLSQPSSRTADAPEDPYPALQDVWRQVVLETLVVINTWRNGRSDPLRNWSPTSAKLVHDASCQRVLATLTHRYAQDPRSSTRQASLIREIRGLFASPALDVPPLRGTAQARHVLFFDGGSRGNPGAGGAGACIVRVEAPTAGATIVWSAAMSLASPSTTNNQAEYFGLLTGLRAALAHQWSALDVIGDSALVLRQLRDLRQPRHPRLLRLYREARRLSDQLDVRSWIHHARSLNRMADCLANTAMDARASSQVKHPTTRSGHAELHAHLGNDLGPWLAATLAGPVDHCM